VDVGLALTRVCVVEAELIAAVVTHRHGDMAEVHHFDVMRVTRVCAVHVVTPVHGSQRGPNDRVGTVRCHVLGIGNNPTTP
jgi:hypothetical protein